ncbi:hypothetical protein TRVA0_003S01244 [Trichomonascus vanleenenianus]|uniref:Zn(II)2Cys6 transcription factor n=1 Tax=Trichomonascus vanleenenianus TaxID=2268995 RepID=UPI003ECAEE0D
MPRPKISGKPIKRRSRGGCHNCKRLKIKCDEKKPTCSSCTKHNTPCDYSLKLSWGGRPIKKGQYNEGSIQNSTLVALKGVEDAFEQHQEHIFEKFGNLSKVFVPTPDQAPVGSDAFVFEYMDRTNPRPASVEEIPQKPLVPHQPSPSETISIHSSAFPGEYALISRTRSPHLFADGGGGGIGHVSVPHVSPHEPHEPHEMITEIPRTDLISEPALNPISWHEFFDDMPFAGDFAAIEDTFPDIHSEYRRALMQVPLRNLAKATNNYCSSKSSPYEVMSSPTSDSSGGDSPIHIPKELSPMPDILLQVPFYRDCFYHFVNVTADVLVPVPRQFYPNNPFRTILPRMALSTPHLLTLLLAYGASHRAQVMGEPEPVEVLSQLMNRTFDGLSRSLEDHIESKSDSTLATAIMLSSYEIFASNVIDSWRTHLHGAREIVVARGLADNWHKETGPHQLKLLSPEAESNEVSSFLLRAFAYIDVIGALSSSDANSVLLKSPYSASHLWSIPITKRMSSKVDFLLGVDLDMILVFSKVSSLARKRLEVDQMHDSEGLEQVLDEAHELSQILLQSIPTPPHANPASGQVHFTQLQTMNVCFCYAVLIHLYRRVLLLPSDSFEVQDAVRIITGLLDSIIPVGSSIEACMSFPIFTAGCEARDDVTKEKYRVRMTEMQRFGITQIYKAREAMELCWLLGKPWMDVMKQLGWEFVLA